MSVSVLVLVHRICVRFLLLQQEIPIARYQQLKREK
jgi:hypothetical protein